MSTAKNRRYKFTPQQLKAIQTRYELEGWRLQWLGRYYKVHRSTILFHIRKRGWIRRVPVAEVMPEEIAKSYRMGEKFRYLDNTYNDSKKIKKKMVEGSYEYIRHMAEQQRLRSCQHVRWIKRCSICGTILESDSINHQHSTSTPGKAL